MSALKVSVCMPAYNAERFIGEAVASVLAQDFKDFELIVSDNASSDATAKVVRLVDDGRVRYARNQKNVGFVKNLNLAFAKARGEYVVFLCADDAWKPGFLSAMVKTLDTHRKAAFAFSGAEIVKAGQRQPFAVTWKPGRIAGREFFKAFFTSGGVALSSTLARREAVAAVGGFDESLGYSPDAGLWLRLSLHHDAWFVPETLSVYRVHARNLTGDFYRTGTVVDEKQRLIARLKSYPGYDSGLDESFAPLREQFARDLLKMRMSGVARRDVLGRLRSLEAKGNLPGSAILKAALLAPAGLLAGAYRAMKAVRGEAAWG